jgi:hypothetical protein
MQAEPKQSDDWAPCSPGTLTRVARGLRSHERHRFVRRAAAAAAMVVLAVGAGVWALQSARTPEEHFLGGLWCSEVRENLQAYSMGNVDSAMAAKIRSHLDQCPACQKLMRQMQQQEPQHASRPVDHWSPESGEQVVLVRRFALAEAAD